MSLNTLKHLLWDFPGGPVVETLPSNAWGLGSILGWEAKILHVSWSKNQRINNRSNIVTNSVKALKTIYIKKQENPPIVCPGFKPPGSGLQRGKWGGEM